MWINTLKCNINILHWLITILKLRHTKLKQSKNIKNYLEGSRLHIYNMNIVWHSDIVDDSILDRLSGRQKRRELVWPFSKFQIPRRRDTRDCLMEMEKGRTRCRFAEGRRFLPVWDVAAKCAKGSFSLGRARRFAPNWKRQWPTYATYVIDFFLLTTTNELIPVKRYPSLSTTQRQLY